MKKAEYRRIDAFELWCWRKESLGLQEDPTGQSRGINSEYLLEELMLKLKLQFFGHLMQRAESLEKTLILGNSESRGRSG